MKIGIVGCAGHMGRALLTEVLSEPEAVLVGGSEHENSSHVGCDLGALVGLPVTGLVVLASSEDIFSQADVVIDFTTPSATLHHLALAIRSETALVIGTTGLGEDHREQMRAAGRHVTVVQAPNMSVGVNLLFALTEKVSGILGPDYDIEIVEMHHRRKVDAPSGTALGLGKAAAKGRNVDLETVSDRVRDGVTGPREKGHIGFATLRGGDVIGDHTVIFATEGERIELTHKASSRAVFAKGAVRAALWTKERPPGLYSMLDVLSLS